MKLLRDYTATMELPQDQAFEAAVKFYLGQGYEKGSSDPPAQASFVGYKEPDPGVLGRLKGAKTRQMIIELSFASITNDRTTVKCKYTMPVSTSSSDWSKVREEVEALEKVRTLSEHPEVEN